MTEFIAVVDRFEGDFAVLKHKDHEILLPKDDLPENISEGNFVTIITLSGKEEKKKEQQTEKTAKEKIEDILGEKDQLQKSPDQTQKEVNESLKKEAQETGIVTSQDRINKTFAQKPRTQKLQEAVNDVLGTVLGQESVYESPEKKEIKELKNISGQMDKVNKNIQEEIKEHKTHE
jgi:hypothetical protein